MGEKVYKCSFNELYALHNIITCHAPPEMVHRSALQSNAVERRQKNLKKTTRRPDSKQSDKLFTVTIFFISFTAHLLLLIVLACATVIICMYHFRDPIPICMLSSSFCTYRAPIRREWLVPMPVEGNRNQHISVLSFIIMINDFIYMHKHLPSVTSAFEYIHVLQLLILFPNTVLQTLSQYKTCLRRRWHIR